MPRTTKGRGYRITKDTTRVARGSQESRVQTRSQGSTVAGQKRRSTNPGEGASRSKRGRGVSQDTEAGNEAPTTPLTQADIPQIIEAVLNNLPAPHETTYDDDSHTEDNLGDTDYTSGPYTVTFSAGSTTASFNVSSIDDNVLESDEKFILTIDPSSLPNNVIVGSSNHSTITILDDEVLMVEFSKPTFSGSEITGAVPVTLMLRGGTSASAISVTVTPFDQTPVSAEGNGRDYTSTPINATFPVGTGSIIISVPVTKDNIIEEIETFKLNLSMPSSVNGRVILGNITTATVTIIDDTDNAVRFGQAKYIVNENDGIVQVLLNLTNPSTSDTIVKVFSVNESANGGGVDYGSVPQTVIFPAGITAMFLNISITNDAILENNETFALNIDPSSDVISVDPSEAKVKIVDDDIATVSFNQSVYSVDENGGLVQPVIVLSNPSSTVITIRVTDIQPEVEGSALLPPGVVSDTDMQDTATGGDDYMPGPYNVLILAGQTHVVFDVSIMNDTTIESNESFTLAIIPESLPEQIKIEIPDRTTITIVDNDVATVFFGQSMYSVSENIGLAQPEIVLSNPSSTDITVQVTVYNGTATEGVDYASGSYNIEIPAGQTHVEFNVTIMDDNTVESDEYFLLVITSGSLPNKFSPGNPNITNVTIVENDGVGTPIKPTVVVLPGQQIELTVNNFTLLMKCLLYNMINVNFKWEKKNSKLPSTAQGVYSDQLTITKLSPKDSGEYRCIVSNSTGMIASDYSLVTIKDPSSALFPVNL